MATQKAIVGAEDAVGRHKDDFYMTPAAVTKALVDELKLRLFAPSIILDLACGAGAIGRVCRQAWPKAQIDGAELDAGRARGATSATADPLGCVSVYDTVWLGDVFAAGPLPRAELVISNPPFRHALAMLKRAMGLVRVGGIVAFLLPSQWSQETTKERERGQFLDRLRLLDGREGFGRLVFEGRVDFKGDGNTDRITYDWYLIGPGFEGTFSRVPRYAAKPPMQLILGGASDA